MPGWKAYFPLAHTPRVWRSLDEWLRHRLRAIHLKHGQRGTTAFRELRALGADVDTAASIASGLRRWWYSSALSLNRILTMAYFDKLGVPKLC